MSNDKKPHFTVLSIHANDPLPASRHSDITQLSDDVYFVRGRMPTTPSRPLFARLFLYFSRTMTIVRDRNQQGGYDLTLFNSIRLSEDGLKCLDKLGQVKNIVRLGSFHGIDDAFYLQHYKADYWIVDGMNSAEGLSTTPRLLSESALTEMPIPGTKAFIFSDIAYPEAIYLLPPNQHREGIAITTDSIQNHTSVWDIDNSLFVSLAIWRIGLVGRARLGPIWLREQTPKNKQLDEKQQRNQEIAQFFRPQFERLLNEHNFDMLIPGHGWPIYRNAKAAIKKSMNKQLKLD